MGTGCCGNNGLSSGIFRAFNGYWCWLVASEKAANVSSDNQSDEVGANQVLMRLLTARLLLILLLVSAFAPVALAISTPAPHACCMRKAMRDGQHEPEIQSAPDCCRHDCCRFFTVSLWAHLQPSASDSVIPHSAPLPPASRPVHRTAGGNRADSVRAPPQFSIA